MKVMTFSTYRTVEFLTQKVEVPIWVKYLAIKARPNSVNADIIGFSHKPYITTKALWRFNPNLVNTKQEVIGVVTNGNFKFGNANQAFSTLTKVF